jgi:hypothetical protein
MLLRTTILCLVAMPCAAFSQVHSLTLGFEVNSPYGLSEPWYTIRSGLLRSDDLQTVAERPDVRTATAEATTKGGQLPDLAKLQKAVSESGAGATLRGVEATIEGELVSAQDKWTLRVAGKEIPLQPLTELVQQERKRPRPATAEELGAFERLTRSPNEGKRWLVTGPLRWQSALSMEVRTFERPTPQSNKQGKL